MSEIQVVVERTLDATPDAVFGALADYAKLRPTVLPPEVTDYAVLEGGKGAGTRFRYQLHATKKRIRHVEAQVSEPQAAQLLETDVNSSLLVRWDVAPAPAGDTAAAPTGGSLVTVRISWQGATGIGGFFERTFAPRGITRIYSTELDNLARAVG